MIKFEDDNPLEKYELIQDWSSKEETHKFLSETEYQSLLKAMLDSTKQIFLFSRDNTVVRIADIKRIQPNPNWKSAHDKLEDAKNQHIADLWWKFKHARQLDEISNTMSFEKYLIEVLGKSEKTIAKIKERLIKTGNKTIEL